MAELYRVLYCSRNLITGEPAALVHEIQGILAASRRNNTREGITGGLLFSQGCFAQVLEGPLDAVENAFERIQCDERHNQVTILHSGAIAARNFPDWSMAFSGTPSPDNPLAGVTLQGAFANQSSAAGEVLDLLRAVVVRETTGLPPDVPWRQAAA